MVRGLPILFGIPLTLAAATLCAVHLAGSERADPAPAQKSPVRTPPATDPGDLSLPQTDDVQRWHAKLRKSWQRPATDCAPGTSPPGNPLAGVASNPSKKPGSPAKAPRPQSVPESLPPDTAARPSPARRSEAPRISPTGVVQDAPEGAASPTPRRLRPEVPQTDYEQVPEPVPETSAEDSQPEAPDRQRVELGAPTSGLEDDIEPEPEPELEVIVTTSPKRLPASMPPSTAVRRVDIPPRSSRTVFKSQAPSAQWIPPPSHGTAIRMAKPSSKQAASRLLSPRSTGIRLMADEEPALPPVEEEPQPLPAREPGKVEIPLNAPPETGEIEVTPSSNGKISLMVRDAPLNEVLAILATQQGLNVVAAEDVTAKISVTLHDVSLEDAISAITAVGGYTWFSRNNIVMVTKLGGESQSSPSAQGRAVQVFNLNYVTATDVEVVAKGLISPNGKLFSTLSKPDDNRRTREVIVVEDLPEYIARVADYILQVDRPPRQVLIEGHVLQITLKDDTKHGVNWNAVAKAFGGTLTAATAGFANPAAPTGSFLSIDGTDVDALLEALKTTTDAKTLAQPKVLVLNGQEAKIQIGNRFGYLVTTTTQTSTLQNVNFLNVGVLLTVTPHISDDNQVLLSVKPEVSSGQINPATNLPDSQTTEVETTVLLPDGKGIIIGGLIKENNSDSQTKVPLLGDLWLAGRLFQKRVANRERTEIVIALVPRVLPYPEQFAARDEFDFQRATSPVVTPDLRNVPRPGEGRLPDAMRNPRRLKVGRLAGVFDVGAPFPHPPEYFFPTVFEERPWLNDPEDAGP